VIEEHARFQIDPANSSEFESALDAAIAIMLTAEGCVDARSSRSVDREGVYLLRVVWRQLIDHTEKFPASEQARACADLFAHYLTAGPKVTHYEMASGK
jgi:quinol monooxygenase YgiN